MVEANINAMLDKAENPQRMLRLMIQDMEDTLVEMKVACAQTMAERAHASRSAERVRAELENWRKRAELAISKNREDLAREALLRKREIKTEVEKLDEELRKSRESIAGRQNEIELVEDKLAEAREKLRELTGNPQAPMKKNESAPPPKVDENMDSRTGEKAAEREKLRRDEEIEKELSELKDKLNNK
jgi:phage shock protein A